MQSWTGLTPERLDTTMKTFREFLGSVQITALATLSPTIASVVQKTEEPPTRPQGWREGPKAVCRKAEQLLNQGQSVADVCRRALEVSAATYHRWQQLYGGMKATEAKRL
jgi:hypothetical protein